jgi:hypothetical protein
MRTVRWLLMIATVVALVGAFLPCVQLRAALSVSKRSAISFYGLVSNQDLVHEAARRYDGRPARALAAALLGELGPRGGRLGAGLALAHEALGDYEDARTVASSQAVRIGAPAAGWGLLALLVAIVAYAGAGLSGRRIGRLTAIVFAALALVAAALATSIYWGVGEAMVMVHDELGRELLERGAGLYLMPIGAWLAWALASVAIFERRGR